MVLYAMLALCALLAAGMVYRYDLYDREPAWALAVATAVGAGMMFLAGRVQVEVISRLGATAARDVNLWMSLAAAVTEEMGKVAAVGVVALLPRRVFNDPMDGIIYGSFAGLGCALEESVAVLGWPGARVFLPAQEPVRLLGHLVMGGIGGFALGLPKARPRVRWWPLAAAGCLATAAAIHFLWDWIAFSAADQGRMSAGHTAGAVGLMLAGLGVYGAMVAAASGLSRRALDPSSPRRLAGWPFTRGGDRAR